jgi:hypothetical protein
VRKDQLIKVIEQTALLVWNLSIGPTPRQKSVMAYLDDLQPGDLVLEVTSQALKSMDGKRFGKLLKFGREPIHTNGEWEELVTGGIDQWFGSRPTQMIYHIETPDGETVRWENARFIRVMGTFQERYVATDGAGGVRGARRCPDCGATKNAEPHEEWTQFDPETLQCRSCKAGRPARR